jgi:short-subunit dehydrogenase
MQPAGDKAAVITGGAGAIGRAIARHLMQRGYRAALLDRDAQALLLARESLLQLGMQPLTIPCDITSDEQCRAAIDEVVSSWGRVDLLFNNAGLTQIGLFEHNVLDAYRRVMDVNFYGSVHMTRACLPHLIASRGAISVTSSVAGFAPLLGRTGYCASKHALHGFFDSLRHELRDKGVGVSIACPAFVDSGFSSKGVAADGGALKEGRSETGTPLSPEEVATAIVEGVLRRKPLVLIGRTAKLAWCASRLAPQWYARQMLRRFERELRRDSHS